MASQLPVDMQQLIQNQLAIGLYSNPDDVLRGALHLLVDHQETMDDLRASVEDVESGRVVLLESVVAEIRQRHGWSS
jgi:Arc/MetJ-type ribon-helix-helix transcriptional regulator